MEKQESRVGSLAEFIDRTILQCLIEYDRALEHSPVTQEADYNRALEHNPVEQEIECDRTLEYNPVTLETEYDRALEHNPFTQEIEYDRTLEHNSDILETEYNRLMEQNPITQAVECLLQPQEEQNQAVVHDILPQEPKIRASGHHRPEMKKVIDHFDSDSNVRSSTSVLPHLQSVDRNILGGVQFPSMNSDSPGSEWSMAPSSSKSPRMPIPSYPQLTFEMTQLSGVRSESQYHSQNISEPKKHGWPEIQNDTDGPSGTDFSLSCGPALLNRTSATGGPTDLRNCFFGSPSACLFAANVESRRADIDRVESIAFPLHCAGPELNVRESSSFGKNIIHEPYSSPSSSSGTETCNVACYQIDSSVQGHSEMDYSVAVTNVCDHGSAKLVEAQEAHKIVAAEKVKKRLQKRYFETEAADKEKKKQRKHALEEEPAKESTAVETFTCDGEKVSNWRIKKWKKRRLQPGEDGDTATSKKQLQRLKHKPTGKPGKQQKQQQKKMKERSVLDDLEQPGFIEYGSEEEVDRLSQTEIAEAVDVTSATKHFELNLTDFGPYSINYSRNGRHLLLGGERGHVAAFEWQTKRLSFEMNTEHTSCVRWLHQETMFAASHPSGVCFYDNLGIELHALTNLDAVLRMEFLPHHMLLATANEKGFLGYTDVSMGTRVASICTGLGRLDVMTQNPANAVICLGHAAGTVTLWAPSVKGPLVKILTHKAPVRAIAVDSTGNYLATSGVDKRLKVFDLRTYKMLNKTHIPVGASSVAFSQRGLLAAALGNRVQVYKDCKGEVVTPYLSHVVNGTLRNVQFCPFEDVLGVGHQRGFSSLLVPGAGEANYDALSVNPLANNKQRQNTEVRLLLDKLQPEMIGLTNWVWELANKSGSQKAPQASAKKLGKKQKEEMHREKTRESLKEKKTQKTVTDADSNPLSRFRKSQS